MNILITGMAGFIGFHLAKACAEDGHKVVGIDNINDYYDQKLKFKRLEQLGIAPDLAKTFNKEINSHKYDTKIKFYRLNLEDKKKLNNVFETNEIDVVCNLAAQAGVRYSLINPDQYIQSNIVGFINMLELCKKYTIKKIVYASSSSVYGDSINIPFKEIESLSEPISLYAATKLSNELMAYTYSHLFNIETIGLRFFTVYGPWGRPDMALFLFTKAILENKEIDIYNNGELYRDFTYIDDIIMGVKKIICTSLKKTENSRLYNIGRGEKINLMDFIGNIEGELNKIAKKNYLPRQPGDVFQTFASCKKLFDDYGYKPTTNIKDGINKFIDWYKVYYEVV